MAAPEFTPPVCGCGCGRCVKPYPRTNSRFGHVKGEYAKFLVGHKIAKKRGYRQVKVLDLSVARVTHRARAEAALGHPLPPGAEIHHVDRDLWNPLARLVICPSRAYHRLLHARMRVKEAGGNPNTDGICARCHQVKPRTAFYPTNCVTAMPYGPYCRDCDDIRRVERLQRQRETDPEHVLALQRERGRRWREKRKAQQAGKIDNS